MIERDSPLPRGRTTTDLVADALRKAILAGNFQQGEELTQDAIATRYKVSRIPVREAMRRLEAEGLITFHANRGAVVTRLTAEDVREIYELRMLLEGDLIQRAVRSLKPGDIQRVEQIHVALNSERRPESQAALNRGFHLELYASAKRPRQVAIVESLRNLVERYENLEASLMKFTPAFQKDHKQILTAFRNRDAKKARQRVIEHLQNAMQVTLKVLKKPLRW